MKTLFLIPFLLAALISQSQNASNVSLAEHAGNQYKLSNGLCAFLLPKNPTPNGEKTLAPIQNIIYKDGKYGNDGQPVYLKNDSRDPVYPLTVKTTIEKNTADEVVIKILYTFNKPAFTFPDVQGKPGTEAGAGEIMATFQLKRGWKSVLIEFEGNYDFYFDLPFNTGLDLNQARYNGFNSSSVEEGREPDGKQYRAAHERKKMDATIDIDNYKDKEYPRLHLWDPHGAATNTGHYWQFYNKDGKNNSLFGMFAGRTSKAEGATQCGAKLVFKKGQPFIRIFLFRRGDDASWFPRKCFEIGLFVSTKEDLKHPLDPQGIGIEWNNVAGLGARIDSYTKPMQPSTPFMKGALFMDIQPMIARVKNDKQYANKLQQFDGSFTEIINLWRGEGVQEKVKEILKWRDHIRQELKTGNGIQSENIKYWKGAIFHKQYVMTISALFADKSIILTFEQKTGMLETLSMIARMVWDNDFVPMQENFGGGMGNANMIGQYISFRNMMALIFKDDPEFKKRGEHSYKEIRETIDKYISNKGIVYASVHYIQASIEPHLFAALQLKQSGLGDLFTELKPKFQSFIKFYSSFLRPAQDKLITIGDGLEEPTAILSLLAAGYADSDPALSKKLYGLPYKNSDFGYSLMAVNTSPEYTAGKLPLASESFEDYHNVIGVGNTTLWHVLPKRFIDHGHHDQNSVVIYALGFPLTVSSSAFYTPHVWGSKLKSMVLPVTAFPEWNQTTFPLDGSYYKNIESTSFNRNTSIGRTGGWERKVTVIAIDESKPIIVIIDKLPGKDNIWSMPFMSTNILKQANGFKITGQQGIDWYLLNNNTEYNVQELKTNTETMQYLRVRGANFFNVILPFVKGADPYTGVKYNNGKISVPYNGQLLTITETGYSYKGKMLVF